MSLSSTLLENAVDQHATLFGNCSNIGACEVECPKGISLEHIARMNREYVAASVSSKK